MTAYRIPDDWRVCGESMWARRSIAYRDLPGVFIVFGIWDETDTLLGWDDTVDWAQRLELPVVPVLYRGGSLTEARAAWAAQRDAGDVGGLRGARGRADPGRRVLRTRSSNGYGPSTSAPRRPGATATTSTVNDSPSSAESCRAFVSFAGLKCITRIPFAVFFD